jgi:hypothetical protein
MSKGGEMDEDEGVDLFEDYDDQPAEVSAILEKYDLDDANYETLKELHDELKSVGYTFEYGLDGYAYDLRKIGQKGKSEFYAKGGYVVYDKFYDDKGKLKVRIIGEYKTRLGAKQNSGSIDGLRYSFTDVETFNELYDSSKIEKNKMEKGGEVFYKESHKLGM